MSLLSIILVAVGLAMDAFTVSLAAGASGWTRDRRARFRLWFHFGLFQALMPVVGWLAGSQFARVAAVWAPWLAFGMLGWIGVRMIVGGLDDSGDSGGVGPDPTRGRTMLGLAIATSLDALAVGFSFACLGLSVWLPAVVIGVVAGLFSLAGCFLGGMLGRLVGRRLEAVGGMVLVLVGLQILWDQLLG